MRHRIETGTAQRGSHLDVVSVIVAGQEGDRHLGARSEMIPQFAQLMNHTAGCGYFFTNEQLTRYAELTRLPSVIGGLKASLMSPLACDPGTRWEYGISTDWLGLVVEAVSGQTLDAYLAQSLYQPLGMSDTSFAPSAEQRARLMELQLRMPDGSLGPLELDLPEDPEWASAGGGSCLHPGTRMMRRYCGWPCRHSGRWSRSRCSCSRTR